MKSHRLHDLIGEEGAELGPEVSILADPGVHVVTVGIQLLDVLVTPGIVGLRFQKLICICVIVSRDMYHLLLTRTNITQFIEFAVEEVLDHLDGLKRCPRVVRPDEVMVEVIQGFKVIRHRAVGRDSLAHKGGTASPEANDLRKIFYR